MLAQVPPELRTALRRGRRDDVVAWMLAATAREREAVAPAVRAFHRRVRDAASGERSPAAEWSGGLRPAHWSAAAAAYLAVSPLSTAVRHAPLDPPDAHDLPLALFGDHLDAFAREWSERFVRHPGAWDRIRGLEAMFDWAHEGLLAPPTYDGAVLLLVANGGAGPRGRGLLAYLEARPVLIGTTMARIFDVPVVAGASLAQADETRSSPRRRLDGHVIPELVARGHWSARAVLDGVERALAREPHPYHRRWFEGVRDRVGPG